MGLIYVKNNTANPKAWCGQEIQPQAYYQIPENETEEMKWAHDDAVLISVANSELKIATSDDGVHDFATIDEAISYLKDDGPMDVHVGSSPPFADPTHRTKIDATPEVVTVEITNDANVPYIIAPIDFLVTEELYVSGGEIGATNVQIGDYITAEVYDKDGVIPAPYRSAVCESWPTVAKYIKKCWMILRTLSSNASLKIDTKPLTARVTAGLYLRVTYYALNTGSNRQIVMNYDLTKKL